jgi:limonene-1,2-epoxide hydrolase
MLKNTIRTAIALLLVLSSIMVSQAQGDSTMPDNAQIIREFIAAWSRLDPEELASYFTEDGTYHNIPASAVSGRDNIVQFIAGFTEYWQSTDWEIISLFAEGDLVLAERIDHTVVNGKPVDLPAAGVFEMEGGKIKVWRDYFDLATYTEALTAALQGQ